MRYARWTSSPAGARRRRGCPPRRSCAPCSSPRCEHGRDELDQKRSGYERAGDGRRRRPRASSPPRPRRRRCAPTPTARRERAWLLVAALVGALVDGRRATPSDAAAPASSTAHPRARARRRARPRSSSPLAFDEQPQGVDRLRAARARRARLLGDVALREPIGAGHPLRIAEAVARLGGRPADPARSRSTRTRCSRCSSRRRAPRARTRTPTRPAASPAGSSSGSTGWGSGAATTPSSPISRAASRATTAQLAQEVGEALLDAGPARREAVGRPAPRVPQPAPRGRHPRADRARGSAAGSEASTADRSAWTSIGSSSPTSCTPPDARERGDHPARAARPARAHRRSRCCAGARRPPPATPAARSATRTRPAIIDELGTLTFREVHERTNALAHALSDAGIIEGDGVAIMCRNHRGFIDATVACSKLGAHALFLNTAFAGPQLTDVVEREKPIALIYDEEFAELVHDAGVRRKRFIAWHDGGREAQGPAARGPDRAGRPVRRRRRPSEKGRVRHPHLGHDRHAEGRVAQAARVARPGGRAALEDPAARAREDDDRRAAVPLLGLRALHARAWASPRRSCCERKFDPEATLSLTAQHECTALVVVPVMLQRILELPTTRILERYDLSALRVVAAVRLGAAGRARDASWMDALRRRSSTTSTARPRSRGRRSPRPRTCAPRPGTAGRPPRGTVVKLYDDDGQPVPSRARPAASSSATRCCSRATRAAAARTSSTG